MIERLLTSHQTGFWNFIVSRFTPQMFTAMGYGVYFFFASLMICSVIFVYFLMPETKNIPLEGIDRLFDRRLKASQAHGIVWKELSEEEEALRIGLTSGSLEKGSATAQIEDVDQRVWMYYDIFLGIIGGEWSWQIVERTLNLATGSWTCSMVIQLLRELLLLLYDLYTFPQNRGENPYIWSRILLHSDSSTAE